MPHSWEYYEMAKQIVRRLKEMQVLNEKGLKLEKTIQGEIQILLEES